MNYFELETEVLAQIGILEPDAGDRSEHRSVIKPALNEGYRKICREKAHLWTVESVTLDADKCFNISSLTERLTTILKVSRCQDFSDDAGNSYSPPFSWYKQDGAGTIFVPNATASTAVYVKYEYMPARLKETYNISGANTAALIPVDEAISAAEAAALAGQALYLIDTSVGTYVAYTIVSATAGAAGAASITVDSTPAVATADGDEIYIGDNWTPVINEDWHILLTYWAIYKIYSTRGANYIGLADYWKNTFYMEYGYITDSLGEPENMKNTYYPISNNGGCYIDPLS